MNIVVKQLKGGECNLQVTSNTSILEIKRQVAEQLNIPEDEQKLLLLGRTLADDQTVDAYPSIKHGTKLNLVVKKPEGLHEISVKYFKKLGMSETEAMAAASRLLKIAQEKFNKLSWDDIEYLSLDCLTEEGGQPRMQLQDMEVDDDIFSL